MIIMSESLKIAQWFGAFVISLAIVSCPFNISRKDEKERKSEIKMEVNQLGVDFGVLNPLIKKGDDLVVRITLTNKSDNQIKLNGLFLEIPKILLKVRKADGTPIYPGSPPIPFKDDGKTGRIYLAPGQATTFTYKGSDYFGVELSPGKYQVKFRHQNTVAEYGDWTGTIETDWVNFEVRPSSAHIS